MMKVIKGNLVDKFLDGEFDIIIHGCNCQKAMGAGIAREIAIKIPEAKIADDLYDRFQHNVDKLSNFSLAMTRINNKIGFVVNLYTQYMPGPDLDENALLLGFKKLSKKLLNGKDALQYKIGIPKIGCGIGGADWNQIQPKIAKIMEDYNLTYVEYETRR